MASEIINKNYVDMIRAQFAPPAPEEAAAESAKRGVMARKIQSDVSSAMQDTAKRSMSSIDAIGALVNQTVSSRTDSDEVKKEISTYLAGVDELRDVGPDEEYDYAGRIEAQGEDKRPVYRPGTGPAPEFKLNVPDEVMQDTEFMAKVDTLAAEHGINRTDILKAIQFETAGSFSPSQKSGTSNAMGLIQFIPSTAKELGTSTKELAAMTRAQQMDYVSAYLEKHKGKIRGFDDLYMAIHWPAAVGKDNDYEMYAKGSKAYKANKGLDINKDGVVTKGEAVFRART